MTPLTEQTITLDVTKDEWFASYGKQDLAQALTNRVTTVAKALKITKPRRPITLVITIGGSRKYQPNSTSCGPVTEAIIAGLAAYGINTDLITGRIYYPGNAIPGYVDGARQVEIVLVNQEGLW